MQFTLSTKPFADALDLGVVGKNISKYYQKSCLAQLTANRNTLRINLEASYIATEMYLKGSGDCDDEVSVFVDCLLLKSLVSTFEASTTTIEYNEGGIVLHSGSSKFTLPKMIEGAELELMRPELPDANAAKIKLNKDDWKFISDYQMYAIAMSFVHPVYTKVWVGNDGDVIVGDYDNSLFTFSKKNKLGRTCLLSDTIINLLTSLPEGAEIIQMDDKYRIDVKTDAFDYCAQFTPQKEDDAGVGSYNSAIILDMSKLDDQNLIKLPVPALTKFLSQADLLARTSDDSIKLTYSDNQVQLKDANVDCKLNVESTCMPFELEFKTALLKSVLSNVDTDSVSVSPMMQEDAVVGIVVSTGNMSVVLGGID